MLGPGADDAHIAAQDVPRLWHLVEVEPAQHPTDACDAGVVLLGPVQVLFGVHAHRAQLDDLERLPEVADTFLAVEEGTAVLQLERDPDERQEDAKGNQPDERGDDVDKPFEDRVDARRLPALLQ